MKQPTAPFHSSWYALGLVTFKELLRVEDLGKKHLKLTNNCIRN